MKNITNIKKNIYQAKKILIAGHINPDGDCIGSLLSLGLGLRSLRKKVDLYVQGKLPRIYHFLPGSPSIIRTIKRVPDIAIAVDCNTKEMLGRAYPFFQKAETIIEIDHHEYRRTFGTYRFIDHHASSVGEMVYFLLKNMRIRITKEIATNILTSLLIETSSFRLPNVTPKTFVLCSVLMKNGADYYKIIQHLFWSQSREVAILSGMCLSRCSFLMNGQIVWSSIRKKDFHKVKGKDEHVDAVADEMRAIKEVEIAILFREKTPRLLRVSLRSKKKVNVAVLAERYGGGGHRDVAGCFLKNNHRAIQQFLSDAKRMLK